MGYVVRSLPIPIPIFVKVVVKETINAELINK